MPSNPTRDTIIRQWELVMLLPNRGAGKTAKELTDTLNSAGFKVSKRQVERDLAVLMDCFPVECNNGSKPYGWRWIKGAPVNVPAISLAEALSMQIIHGTLKSLLPASMLEVIKPKLEQAQHKLRSLPENSPQAQWPSKVRNVTPALELRPPEIDDDVLETIQEALLHSQQLRLSYQSMSLDSPAAYDVHPIALITKGSVPYLIATTFSYTDIRHYALHRVHSAECLSLKARRPDDFDLDEYIQEGGAQLQRSSNKQISLKLRVKPWLARILEETPLSEDQSMIEEGELAIVRAKVVDTWQLHWWILSQGASLEVLSPKKLRREVAQELVEMSALYVDP